MAVAFDTTTENVRTGTTSPQTFSHAGAASGVKGVVLALVHGTSSTDHVSAASYGGVALARVQRNVDTSTEPGAAELWFLGTGVPQGTQTVSYTPGSTTDDIHAVVITLTGADDLEVVDQDGISENAANPSVTLQYGGRTCIAIAALYGGGVAPSSFTPNGNCTSVHDHDLGAFYSVVIRQTTPGSADFAIGGTASSDDVAYSAIAVSEVVGAQAVTGASIGSGSSLTVPTMAYRVAPAALASGLALFAPTVAPGPVAVTGGHRATTVSLFAPTVAMAGQAVEGAHRASTATLTAPTLAYGVQGAHRSSSLVLTPPTVVPGAVTVTGAHRTSSLILSAPTVSQGAQPVTGAHRSSTASLAAPTVAYRVVGATRESTASLPAPTVAPGAVTVVGGHRAAAPTLWAPTASQPSPTAITAAHVASGASLRGPVVAIQINAVTSGALGVGQWPTGRLRSGRFGPY